MTVKAFADALKLKVLSLPDPDREIDGVYIGDLLSWVMGRAESGNLWITIMSNVNVAAVASLADISAVILAEGVTPDQGVTEVARGKQINILSSDRSAYEIAVSASEVLK